MDVIIHSQYILLSESVYTIRIKWGAPHFRHSKAMHLLKAGVNLIYIRDFLGHSSIVTTEVYTRLNPKIKKEHLRKNSASLEVQEKYSAKEKDDLMNWLKNLFIRIKFYVKIYIKTAVRQET